MGGGSESPRSECMWMHAGELDCEHRLGVAGGVDESVHGLGGWL